MAACWHTFNNHQPSTPLPFPRALASPQSFRCLASVIIFGQSDIGIQASRAGTLILKQTDAMCSLVYPSNFVMLSQSRRTACVRQKRGGNRRAAGIGTYVWVGFSRPSVDDKLFKHGDLANSQRKPIIVWLIIESEGVYLCYIQVLTVKEFRLSLHA